MTLPRARIVLQSDLELPSYAIIGDLMARTLRAAGLDVEERPLGGVVRRAANAIVVQNTIGPRFVRGRATTAVALVHHEWDRYPRAWVDCLDTFTEVWVTTTFVQRTLVRSGVRQPVRLVRPGLDVEGVPARREYGVGTQFQVLACGAPHFRKGFHLLIDAYLQAFPRLGQARLVMHTDASQDWVSPRADVVFDRRRVSRRAMLAMYQRFDLVVSTSLGEGLGLPLAEAILAGVPVAAAAWGGHRDLLTAGGFLPVPHDVLPQPYCSRPDYFAPGQRCALVSIEGLAGVLRHASAMSPTARRAQATRGREALLARYGVQAAARRIRAARTGVLGALNQQARAVAMASASQGRAS